MKYLSIDLETTGLDPVKHHILTFSAILEDTSKKLEFEACPKLNVYVLRDEIIGSPYAINMNSKIIASISRFLGLKTDEEKIGFGESVNGIFLQSSAVASYFYLWNLVHHQEKQEYLNLLDPIHWCNRLQSDKSIKMVAEIREAEGPITVNAAGKNFATFDKKFIDQIEKFYYLVRFRQRVLDPSVLFIDWENDTSAPDLAQCKERAQIEGIVTHDSIYDAWDVVSLFRKHY
jgi:hypothetical protein